MRHPVPQKCAAACVQTDPLCVHAAQYSAVHSPRCLLACSQMEKNASRFENWKWEFVFIPLAHNSWPPPFSRSIQNQTRSGPARHIHQRGTVHSVRRLSNVKLNVPALPSIRLASAGRVPAAQLNVYTCIHTPGQFCLLARKKLRPFSHGSTDCRTVTLPCSSSSQVKSVNRPFLLSMQNSSGPLPAFLPDRDLFFTVKVHDRSQYSLVRKNHLKDHIIRRNGPFRCQ